MRNEFIGLAGVLVCAGVIAVVGCGSDDPGSGDEAVGGSSASGGNAGSSSGSSGAAGGGASGGAATSSASDCVMTEGGTAVTRLCGEAPLNTLTQAEVLQLCDDTGAYVAGAVDRAIGCKYVSIVASASSSAPTDEEMQAVCAAREMACNQDATIMNAGELTQCNAIPATCTATVADYSTCVMDEAVVFEQGAGALVSCAMLTVANLSTLYDVPIAATNAPGCMAIKAACPNFGLPYIN